MLRPKEKCGGNNKEHTRHLFHLVDQIPPEAEIDSGRLFSHSSEVEALPQNLRADSYDVRCTGASRCAAPLAQKHHTTWTFVSGAPSRRVRHQKFNVYASLPRLLLSLTFRGACRHLGAACCSSLMA